MKTLKIASVIVLSLLLINMASIAKTPNTKKDYVRNQLKKHISFPEIQIENGSEKLVGLVIVDFTVIEKGKVIVNAINFSHEEFKNQVLKTIEIGRASCRERVCHRV